MNELKQKLLDLKFVIDNEFLDKYVDLIMSNTTTAQKTRVTQRHHIIPRYYFKNVKCNVDNSKTNLVNLMCKDHILAHAYLMMCSSDDKFKVNNLCSINRLGGSLGLDVGKIFCDEHLDAIQYEYEHATKMNSMFVQEYRDIHDSKMREQSTRNSISKTMREKFAKGELNAKLQSSHLGKGTKGLIYVHRGDELTAIEPDLLEQYINDGWVKGARPLSESHKQALLKSLYGRKVSDESRMKMSLSHIGKRPSNYGIPRSDETKQKLRDAIRGRKWMNNGIVQKQVRPEEIELYAQNGFIFGQLKRKEVVSSD